MGDLASSEGVPATREPGKSPLKVILGVLAVGGIAIAKFGKLLLIGLKFLKVGPFLKTGGTMILSVWFYQLAYGWPFAVGFVLSLFVHEMGHVVAAWMLGVPVTAPVFIPFAGAFILQKEAAKSAMHEAIIGIGGPLGGTIAALACWGIAVATGSNLFLALAFVGFMINLFNLMPMYPLDGGWIVGAISPYLWIVGIVMMGAMVFSGAIRNPFIIILLILSLPRLWRGLRTGTMASEGQREATFRQKLVMGVAYIVLCGFVAWCMGQSHHLPANQVELSDPLADDGE